MGIFEGAWLTGLHMNFLLARSPLHNCIIDVESKHVLIRFTLTRFPIKKTKSGGHWRQSQHAHTDIRMTRSTPFGTQNTEPMVRVRHDGDVAFA